MAHIVRNAAWCEIDLDTAAGVIFLQLKWHYTWLVRPPLLPWSLAEKRGFHNSVDRAIWASWSNRVNLSVSGAADFAQRFRATRIRINLDVRWVLSGQQWDVTVTKIADNAFATSSVVWNSRTITLDSNDATPVRRCTTPATAGATPVCHRQIPAAHEFGHAAGNTAVLSRGDEYHSHSTHTADDSSIMNIGNQLRGRHFTTILEELNAMIPNCTFAVAALR